MHELLRWINEPTVCGSYSIRHKIAHLLGINKKTVCVGNIGRGITKGIEEGLRKEDE